jgi:hypothetical protein
MGFFTSRERAQVEKPTELRARGRVREVVRQDFAPRRRPAEADLAGHVGTLMRQVAEASLREIDDLVIELRRRREELLSESARVQREVVEYAELSQSTMQSTKIITESLAYLSKVSDAPSMGEPQIEPQVEDQVEDNSNEAGGESGSEELAQHGEDHEALGGQAEAIESPGKPAAETPERT